MFRINPDDDRLQPGAYVTNGTSLYEVMQYDGKRAALQNVKTDAMLSMSPWLICMNWELVMKAPSPPDCVGSAATEVA